LSPCRPPCAIISAHSISSPCRVSTTRNPTGAAAAWWCEIVKAGPVIRAARRHGGDIPAAARALGLVLTHDATILARAPVVLARIRGRHGFGTKDRRAARVQSRVPPPAA